MTREFKYRIWDKKQKRFRKLDSLSMIGAYFTLIDMNKLYDDYVIQQFTGLKDKNGREIYEGDIVEFLTAVHGNKITGQVVFDEGQFQIEETCDPLFDALYYQCSNKNPVTLSVIGNIFETPELLE